MTEREIFVAAFQQTDPVERGRYLDDACGADEELRRRVENLLSVAAGAGSFLESPAANLDATIDQLPAESLRTQIGPYKLVELLGEGGMGAVYLAQQTEPVKRLVALKVIKAGMDSKQVLARFEAERQALALMDHPNIAKVLDAGFVGVPASAGASEDRLEPGLHQEGRPYFVMELVKGVPITKFCDGRKLTPRERLELFLPVCHAIQHAHQKGIIHRDIKPNNVLVALYDGKPVPKVIDFGVAKAAGQALTDRTLVTGFGAILGTPEYMSPEQAEINQLDIDTRSDIYSLGVLLYELLAGSPPFSKSDLEKAGMLEMLRVIREKEPSKPSTKLSSSDALPTLSANRGTEPAKLTKLVRGELDWIVMKALEKDRNRRYETANGFAMDVQRYLADETVEACPPTLGYRLRKFMRRNRRPVVAASVVILALVAGVVGTSVGLVRALEAETSARTAEEHEREAKVEAEKNLEQALKAADTFFTRVSESKLLDKPALQPFRKELLVEAQKHYLELFNKKPNDPKLKAELAASYLRMVIVLTGLDEGPKAVEALEKGLDLIEPLIKEHPGDRELVIRLAGLCTAERPLFRGWSDGLSSYDDNQGLKILQRACALWKKLADDHNDLAEVQGDYATLLMLQGDIYFAQERFRECHRVYEEADARFTKLASNPSLSGEYRINAAATRYTLAWNLQYFGHTREALEKYAESVRMFEGIQRAFPEKPIAQVWVLAPESDLVEYLNWLSRPEEAEALLNRMIPRAEKLCADHPDVPAHAVVLSYLYGHRISTEEGKGRTQAAEAEVNKSLTALERSAAYYPDHPGIQAALAAQYGGLGMFHLRRGDAVRALRLTEQAVSILHKLGTGPAEDHSVLLQLGALYSQMAAIDRNLGRLEHAETAYRTAIVNQSRFLRKYTRRFLVGPDLHASCTGLIELLKSTGRSREADDFIGQTIADWEKLARGDPNKYEFQLQVAQSYAVAGKWDKAVDEYSKAISKWPQRMDLWRGRAGAYSSLGKHDQAVEDYTKVIEFGYRDPAIHAWMFEARAKAYRALKKDENALADLTQATKQWPFLLDPWMWRGNLYRDLGEWNKAVEDYSKAIALKPEHMPAWQGRVLAYARMNEWDKAAAELNKLSEHPSNEPSHRDLVARCRFDLGVHQRQGGQADAAERNWRQSIELWTKLAAEVPAEPVYLVHAVNTFLYSLGPLLQENGRALAAEQLLAGAMPTWAKLARKDLKDHDNVLVDATGLWARLLLDLGKRPQAEQLAAKVIEQWPDNARALFARGKIHLALGQPDKALEDVEKAIRLDPKDGMAPWWWLHRSYAYTALKQEDKALAVLTEATERWPNLWDAWMWRGWFYFQRGRFRDAAADYSKAVTLNPKEWTCWQARGTTSVRLADWDRAIADYEKAMTLQPNDAGLQHELAWLLAHCPEEKLRNPKRAVELDRRAVGINGKNGVYRGALGSALYRAGDWKAAIEELNESIKLRGRHGADMLFLAMAHKRLEQDAEARTWFDRAIEWIEMNAPKDDELRRFRDEATVLLELKD